MDKHDHHTDCALGLVGRVAPRRVRGGSFADPLYVVGGLGVTALGLVARSGG